MIKENLGNKEYPPSNLLEGILKIQAIPLAFQ
jgi:hypothetical protein